MQQTVSPFFFLFLFDLELMGFSNFFFWYFMQMFRIKDPKVSLDFYSRVLGMS
jgi:hypothetical protein